jgi:hypothetical protein
VNIDRYLPSVWRRALISGACAALALSGNVSANPISAAAVTAPIVTPTKRLTMTYYYYWYDAISTLHLTEAGGLLDHMPLAPAPVTDWHSVAWHKQQLSDMTYAGIDVVLPVYWGMETTADDWSWKALVPMVEAARQLQVEGKNPPKIGLFLDTTIVSMRNLTTVAGHDWFYSQFRDYFRAIPRGQWATIDGKPISFLFTSDYTGAMNQATFDDVYTRFNTDFGVRPHIVREASWNYPILRWTNGQRVLDQAHPITTESTYLWGAAARAYNNYGDVAAVGPGFDDHLVPGRAPGTIVDRVNGYFFIFNFLAAIGSNKRMIVIETWNEIHEGSGIAETQEFGRKYLDLSHQLADAFHRYG